MQSGWRLYAVMIALAALTGTVVALALSGGPRLPSEGPRASFSATPTASASVSRLPSSVTSPTPTASPSASPTPADPLLRIRPLVFAWRPTETTAIVEQLVDGGTRLVAVPLSGAAATPLLDLPSGTEWRMRLDGSAIAVALALGSGTSARTRIAALNLQTGVVAWVTPDEPSSSHSSPYWSNDGTVIYYARTALDHLTDEGVYRIRVDGTNLTQLRPPADRSSAIVGLTPDGLGLVLSRSQEGGSLDILDLNTRSVRSLTQGGFVQAWRPNRPRALVSQGGPAGGPNRLVVWDDLVPTSTPTQLITQQLVLGADWDPTATRVVAATAQGSASTPTQLVTMDASGQNKTTIAATTGAVTPYWLRAGIVYLWAPGQARPSEVRLAQPTGTAAPKTLYSASDIVRLTYVAP